MYRLFCFLKLFPMVGKGTQQYQIMKKVKNAYRRGALNRNKNLPCPWCTQAVAKIAATSQIIDVASMFRTYTRGATS